MQGGTRAGRLLGRLRDLVFLGFLTLGQGQQVVVAGAGDQHVGELAYRQGQGT